MECGNVARLVLFMGHVYGWLGLVTTAEFGNITLSNLMPHVPGVKGVKFFLREADDKYVYVQRKISLEEFNIDVRT